MEERIDEIKHSVKKTKKCVKKYEDASTRWIKIPCTNKDAKHINLWESTNKDGTYLLKCQAVVEGCDPLKIMKLNNDNCFETRSQWEGDELMGIEQLEEWVDNNIKIIRYHINIPAPFVWDREFLGFQVCDYVKKHKLHRLFHKTIVYDEMYPCDTSKYVAGTCQTILLIKPYGKSHLVTIYADVQPNGWIPASILPLWKEKLRLRMLLYENVSKSRIFDEIYKEWVCISCSATFQVKPDNGVCRRCKNKNEIVEI